MLPLHLAVRNGRVEVALHLIKLAADVDLTNGRGELPIDEYVQKYTSRYHDELFLSVIPSRSADILKAICKLLGVNVSFHDLEDISISKMLNQLVQRVNLCETVSVKISVHDLFSRPISWVQARGRQPTLGNFGSSLNMEVEERLVTEKSIQGVYLSSLLFFIMDLDVNGIPDKIPLVQGSISLKGDTREAVSHGQAINDIWETFKCKSSVRSLTKQCIRQVRTSMSNLDDISFQSLPVPSRIRKSLMLHDVAEVICGAWKNLPKCMDIEELRQFV